MWVVVCVPSEDRLVVASYPGSSQEPGNEARVSGCACSGKPGVWRNGGRR